MPLALTLKPLKSPAPDPSRAEIGRKKLARLRETSQPSQRATRG